MTTTAVNAIHQPSNFVPSDYTYIDSIDFFPGEDDGFNSRYTAELYDALNASTSTRFNEATGRVQCDHCGSRIRYGAVLLHVPSGNHIVVGHQCLSNRVGNYSHAEFRLDFIRTHAQNTRAMRVRLAKQEAFLAANPIMASLVDYSGSNDFYRSMAQQLRKNGELSERQVAAYTKAVARDAERAAQRAAEGELDAPAPSGKVTVVGKVLSLKVQSSAYGDTLKMLVRDDRGFKVWVSVPAAINGSDTVAGVRVQFTATLEVSDRDECFAFGKRPTKASVLS